MTNAQSSSTDYHNIPNADGFFGQYGGQFVPPELKDVLAEVARAYEDAKNDPAFQAEYQELLSEYVGRPSPLFFARHLTKKLGGAKIYLKREDLNHTGAHKINHTLGEALLAKRMGKTQAAGRDGRRAARRGAGDGGGDYRP